MIVIVEIKINYMRGASMSILGHNTEKINKNSLVDKSSTGKERPWKMNKKNSTLLSESFRRIGKEKRANRVSECGDFLQFVVCPNGHEKFLRKANFCGVRLCPMCGWRRSLKAYHQVNKVAHEANKKIKMRWLFLTLTCKNVEGYELPNQFDELSKSWKRLTELKAFKGSILGFFRATEVTRDKNFFITEERYKDAKKYYDGMFLKSGNENPNYNTYHPHFHVLLAVQPSYFSGKKYIKIADWVKMWRKSMRLDYDPIVHIEVVKSKRDKKMEEKILNEKGMTVEIENLPGESIAEIAKYATKADDFILPNNKIETDEAVQILDASLRGRKLFAYGGVLKDVYDYLRKNGTVTDVEAEDTDLIHTEEKEEKNCKCSHCESNFLEVIYRWLPERKNYYLF